MPARTTSPMMPPTLALRPATQADAPAVQAVFDAAVRAGWTYLGALVEAPMFSRADWEQTIAEHTAPNLFLVAVDSATAGAVVGFAAVQPPAGELFLLFVHPAHGGRGVGRRLLDAAHDALRAAGRREAFLYTHEQNARALAVYRAAGYAPDGSVRESDFRGLPIRERRFVKSL